MSYWFVDYLGYERGGSKEKSVKNRLKVGLRLWNEDKIGRFNLYFDDLITLSSIEFRDLDSFCNYAGAVSEDNVLRNYTYRTYLPNSWNKRHVNSALQILGYCVEFNDRETGVLQLRIPYDRALVERIRSKAGVFQFENIDKIKAFEMPILGSKIAFSEQLVKAIDVNTQVGGFIDNIYSDLKAIGYKESRVNSLINRICCGKYKGSKISSGTIQSLEGAVENVKGLLDGIGRFEYKKGWEITLNSFSEINFICELSSEDLCRQVMCFIDIENPLFKTEEEKKMLEDRLRFLGEKDVCAVEALEKRLTIDVNEIKASLFEDKYADVVSWVAVSFKLQNGDFVKELYTLRDVGLDYVNGFKVKKYEKERELVESLAKSIRDRGTYFVIGHNLPHDFFYLKGVKDSYFIINEGVDKEPGFKVSKGNFYKRIFSEGQEIIDTHRISRVFIPYLSNFGGFSLESVVNNLGHDFKKVLSYDEMRRLEILAINGDRDAANKIAEYATLDIEPLEWIVNDLKLFEKLAKLKKIFPYLSLTELAFTQNSAKIGLDFVYWQANKSQRASGSYARDRMLELQEGKLLFKNLRKKMLKERGLDIRKNYNGDMYYFSLEAMLKDSIKTFNLSDLICQDIGIRQYAKVIVDEALFSYSIYADYMDRYLRALNFLNLHKDNSLDFLRESDKMLSGKLVSFLPTYNDVINLYRAFVFSLEGNGDVKKAISSDTNNDRQMNFFSKNNVFDIEDSKYFKLYNLDENLREKCNEGSKNILRAFRMNFTGLNRILNETKKIIKVFDKEFDAVNLLYLIGARKRLVNQRMKFFENYSIYPDSYNGDISFENELNKAFDNLKNSLSSVDVLGTNGAYFWIDGKVNSEFFIKIK